MAQLVALLSKGEGTWGQVAGLVKQGKWDKVILIGNSFTKNFDVPGKEYDMIEVDTGKPLTLLKQEMLTKLKPHLSSDFSSEVALSIASGDGKEHMALISALLSIPVGVRFTALTREGIVFLQNMETRLGRLNRKALDSDFVLPWANEQQIVCGEGQTDLEFENDILFARSLERKGFGLRAKANEKLYLPEEVMFPDRTVATKEEVDLFVRSNGLEFGNCFHAELKDAYSYLHLFKKYKFLHPLN